MIPPPTALVTGATGTLGSPLITALLNRGYTVRTFSRTPSPPGRLPPNVTHFPGSITDMAALDEVMGGVDVVFHLAALLHYPHTAHLSAEEFRHINTDGARLTAERASAAGVKRFVYFSTIKVYGTRQRIPLTEDAALHPKTIYARTKLDGETAVQAVANIEHTILRLSAVYGAAGKGAWAQLAHAISRGRFLPIGRLDNVHSLTHLYDAAYGAIFAAEHPAAAGRILNLVGQDNLSMHTILSAIYATYDRALPGLHIPAAVALSGARLLESTCAVIGKSSSLTYDSVRQLVDDEAYSGAALRAIGFTPHIPITQGWR